MGLQLSRRNEVDRRRPRNDGELPWRASMESFHGELCRTGRVTETDFDLCCRSDRQSVVRGDGQLGPRGDRRVREVEGCRRSPHRLETGPTSTWLWTEIKALGLPV